MRKNASLNMGIEAIVFVILAIIVMALGLVFIRGIFTNLQTKVNEAVSAQDIVNPPTMDTPITATPSSIELRGEDVKKSSVAFLNVIAGGSYCRLDSFATGTPGFSLLYSKECMHMDEDQINVWTVIASPIEAPAQTTVFTVIMKCYNSISDCQPMSGATAEGSFNRDIVVTVRD